MVLLRLLLRHAFRGHEAAVVGALQGERHPEVGVRVELALLRGELGLELLDEGLQDRRGQRERAQRHADALDVAERAQHLHRLRVRHLLHLRRAVAADRDQAVAVQALLRPLGLARHRAERAEDVGVARRLVCHLDRRDEDLIAPVDGEPALAAAGVGAGLLDHRLEDRERHLALAHRDRGRQLHPRLVVVLGGRQRRQPRPLTRRVVQPDAVRAGGQQLRDVDAVGRLGGGAGLDVGVERAEPVARAARPVLVHRQHRRRGGQDHAADGLEPLLPVLRLLLVAGADDDDVVARVRAVDGVDVRHSDVRHRCRV